MRDRSPPCRQPVTVQNITLREHFNYLRNNSCGMSDILNWPNNEAKIQDQYLSN